MKKHYRGVSKKVRDAVWERCDGICEGPVTRIPAPFGLSTAERTGICGRPAEQLAHISHRKIGGSKLLDTPENLLYLCLSCHDKFDLRVFEKE